MAWLSQEVGNVDLFLSEFRQRARDIGAQIWYNELCTKDKLRSYCCFKSLLEPEKYLFVVNEIKHRKCFARLRCSNHKLNIEEGRYAGIDEEFRICQMCAEGIEDEYHFVLLCPLLENIRNRLLPESYCILPSKDKFNSLMSTKQPKLLRNLSKFIYEATELRKDFFNV